MVKNIEGKSKAKDTLGHRRYYVSKGLVGGTDNIYINILFMRRDYLVVANRENFKPDIFNLLQYV